MWTNFTQIDKYDYIVIHIEYTSQWNVLGSNNCKNLYYIVKFALVCYNYMQVRIGYTTKMQERKNLQFCAWPQISFVYNKLI